jgi:hypothetical protein
VRRAWHIESHIEVLSISQSIQYVVVVAVATFLGDQLLVVSIHEMRLGVCVYPKECSFRASDRQDRTEKHALKVEGLARVSKNAGGRPRVATRAFDGRFMGLAL